MMLTRFDPIDVEQIAAYRTVLTRHRER
jgi:hypothetical protein